MFWALLRRRCSSIFEMPAASYASNNQTSERRGSVPRALYHESGIRDVSLRVSSGQKHAKCRGIPNG